MRAALINSEDTLHRLVRISAFGAVLWHMLAGCCMHHVHADPVCEGSSFQATERTAACDCHRDDERHGQQAAPGEGCGHHDHGPCNQTCSFVVPDSRPSVEPELTASPIGRVALGEFVALYTEATYGQAACLTDVHRLSPDRLHVILQVFLL